MTHRLQLQLLVLQAVQLPCLDLDLKYQASLLLAQVQQQAHQVDRARQQAGRSQEAFLMMQKLFFKEI